MSVERKSAGKEKKNLGAENEKLSLIKKEDNRGPPQEKR